MEITKTVFEKYYLEEDVFNSTAIRCATIQFKDGDFYQCDYKLNKIPYSCADWLFLEKVSNKIRELQEKKNETVADIHKRMAEHIEQQELTKENSAYDDMIKENEKIMENCRQEMVAGQRADETNPASYNYKPKKKMTFDDVIWPKGIKPLGSITLTPEMLQITLNELVKK